MAAETVGQAREMAQQTADALRPFNLEFGPAKGHWCKKGGRANEDVHIIVDGAPLQYAGPEGFVFLGCRVSAEGCVQAQQMEVTEALQRGWKRWYEASGVWSSHLGLAVRARALEACVGGTILSAAASWRLSGVLLGK